jgi:hypothetical protein
MQAMPGSSAHAFYPVLGGESGSSALAGIPEPHLCPLPQERQQAIFAKQYSWCFQLSAWSLVHA